MEHQVNKGLVAGVVLFTAAISAALLAFVRTAPFLYVGILAFLCCLFLSFTFNRSRFWKPFFYLLGLALLVGGAAEAYFTWFGTSLISKNEVQAKEWTLAGGDYYVADTARGYAAGANVRKRVRKSLGDRVIYDVVYSTNARGLRVAPRDLKPPIPGPAGGAQNVVFLGDSFTFGEGLPDDAAIPYQLEELSGGRCRSYNFGFHGYGAQQMLRILETGLLDQAVTEQGPLVVVYGALLQHIERASGKMIWDEKVPRYRLNASGVAECVGTFADDPDFAENLKRSKALSDPRAQLLAGLAGPPRTPEDTRLFVQLVRQARDAVAKRQGKFLVLLWPLGDKDAPAVARELVQAGIDVVSVDDVLKEYPDPPEKYRIELDNHPSRLATARIAAYLDRRLR